MINAIIHIGEFGNDYFGIRMYAGESEYITLVQQMSTPMEYAETYLDIRMSDEDELAFMLTNGCSILDKLRKAGL